MNETTKVTAAEGHLARADEVRSGGGLRELEPAVLASIAGGSSLTMIGPKPDDPGYGIIFFWF
jgi:hypothetical protein